MDKEILIVTEMIPGTHASEIHRLAYELMGKARELSEAGGGSIAALLMTAEEPAEELLAELTERGAERIYIIKTDDFDAADENRMAEALAKLVREYQPETVLYGATALGRTLAPRTAALLGAGLTADCTELALNDEGALEQIRPAFSDNILAHITSTKRPQMATVRYKEFTEAPLMEERKGTMAEIVRVDAPETYDCAAQIEKILPIAEAGISEAEIVVAGGRGIKKEEDLALLQELADLLGGRVGVSRALVDAGMATSAIQIGYSGNRVKPKLYFACGISGAPQHLAGMKESDTIIAINSDPSAPIFRAADVGIVGDLYEVVPAIIEMVKGAQ